MQGDLTRVAALGWLAIASLIALGAIVPCCVIGAQLLAWHSGWSTLAGRYRRYQGAPFGTLHERQTVKLGKIRWRRCVDVVVAREGLYMAAKLLFNRATPVLIPWDAMTWAGPTRLYGLPAYRLSVAASKAVSLVLYEALARELVPYLARPNGS